MKTWQKIRNARKEKDYDSAYEHYQLQSDPSDLMSKKMMCWVIYDQLKAAYQGHNQEQIAQKLSFVRNEEVLEIEENDMFFDHFWRISGLYFLKQCKFAHKSKSSENLDQLFRHLRQLPPPKGVSAQIALNGALKVKDQWPKFYSFLDWWNIHRLDREYFKPFITKKGNKIPSTGERTLLAMAKYLYDEAEKNNYGQLGKESCQSGIQLCIEKIQLALNWRVEQNWLEYALAKLHYASGDYPKGLIAIQSFAPGKRDQFWVWALMGKFYIAMGNNKEALKALSRGLSIPVKADFQIKMRLDLLPVLESQQEWDWLKTEIIQIIATGGEKMTNHRQVIKYIMSKDYTEARELPVRELEVLYRENAIQLEREATKPHKSEQRNKKITYKGKAIILPEKKFAFINTEENIDIFVPWSIRKNWAPGSPTVKGRAVQSWDKKKKRWGWRVLSMKKVEKNS